MDKIVSEFRAVYYFLFVSRVHLTIILFLRRVFSPAARDIITYRKRYDKTHEMTYSRDIKARKY